MTPNFFYISGTSNSLSACSKNLKKFYRLENFRANVLNKRCVEYKGYLKSQGYNADLVDNQFDRALSIERSELLKRNVKPGQKVFPLVLDYNPILPDIQKVIQKHIHLLRSSPELLERLSMTFTADGKRQRLPLIFYSFLVILK